MEMQKIANLLGNAANESLKFAITKSNLCDCSDAYILVTGDITATNGDGNTKFAFKNCASFTKYVTHINEEYVDNADNLDIVMQMYNLM